jgi:ribonuclease-3
MTSRPPDAGEPLPAAEGVRCWDPDLDAIEIALGYRFRDRARLIRALGPLDQPLTPETAAARQRLEFLGDAAWNCAVALAIYQAYPHATPGELTRLRAAWSSRTGLGRLAGQLGIPAPALAPHGPSQRVRAEGFEAVMGAMVEDGGFEAVRTLAEHVMTAAGDGEYPSDPDAKSALQMAALTSGARLPSYRLVEKRGPAHHPVFRVSVTVRTADGDLTAEAEGGSRQAAEQEAAGLLLQSLPGRSA